MNFNVSNNIAFEIPLNNVSHTVAQKSEVTVEFHPNDDAALSLMELRFHIPIPPPKEGEEETDPVTVRRGVGIVGSINTIECLIIISWFQFSFKYLPKY